MVKSAIFVALNCFSISAKVHFSNVTESNLKLKTHFCQDLWHQKMRVVGVVCDILCLAVLVQYRLVTSRQTDRQTDGRQTHNDRDRHTKQHVAR